MNSAWNDYLMTDEVIESEQHGVSNDRRFLQDRKDDLVRILQAGENKGFSFECGQLCCIHFQLGHEQSQIW